MEQTVSPKLTMFSKIFGVLSIIFSSSLSIMCLSYFYRMKVNDERVPGFDASFFTETSLTWAYLIFGILFLGGVYIAYLGLKEQKSFNIFMSFVYTFAFISLFVSYIA